MGFPGPSFAPTPPAADNSNRIATTNWVRSNIAVTFPLVVGSGGTGTTTLTAHGVLVGAGASPIVIAVAGATGTVLTSNGTAADPTFQAAASGAALHQQIFTANGTFTVPANTVAGTLFKFIITAGGNTGGNAVGQTAGAGGASAGGTAIAYLSGLTAGSTILVTVGAAAQTSQIASGTQTITTVSASPGAVGGAASSVTPGAGAIGGGTTNATLGLTGGDGAPGSTVDETGGINGSGGLGGASYWGGGGRGGIAAAAGSAANAFGAGGGGGGGNAAGGAGKGGVVAAEWVL